MGLLDTQQSNGLMDFGMGLLSAGGPSRMPVGFGQAMGQGMNQMQVGNQQRQATQMQDMQMQNQGMQLQQHQMQLEQAKKSIADNEMAKVKLTKYVQSLPDTDPNKAHIIQGLTLGVSAKDMYDKINPKQEAFTLPPGGVRFGADNKPIASVPLERKAPEGMNYGVNGTLEEIPGYVVMKSKIAAAGRNPEQAAPYYSPVQTANGVVSFNARTGHGSPMLVNGQTVLGAQADPTLQGQIAGAKEQVKSDVEFGAKARDAVKRSDQLLMMTKKAGELLGQSPTGSGVGAGVDALGRMVGITSDSAKKAAELDTLSGWMVANVPRMEGPQSNFDVQNYQTMAAKVGDRTVPVQERVAALNALQGLQEKYKHLNQGSTSASGASTVRKFNPATGRIE